MYFWLTVVIILSIIECMTIDLVTIWYIASGLCTIVLSLFIDNFVIQFAFFTILGTILLITTKSFLKDVLKSKDIKTNFDRVIGMKGIVTEEINENSIGEVKVDGKRWSAISDKKIDLNKEVIILDIDGVKLKVEEVK